MSYPNRDQLYRSAVEALGREEAETLMSSLPPMDWAEIATKSDLRAIELKLDALEHKLSAAIESGLRKQTQWVFSAVVLLAVAMVVGSLLRA